MTFKIKSTIAALLLAFSASPLFALPEDSSKPIELEADQAKLNNETGVAEYRGNVIIIQGTARLTADKVILHTKNNQVTRMEAFGNPAKYQQILNQGEQPTHIEGQTLDLKVAEQFAEVTGNAKIYRDTNTFSGEKITYSLKTGELNANKGQTNSESRVKAIFIPPTKSNPDNDTPTNPTPPTQAPKQ
jgi:lipopolysaccharide export system protein LptA